MNQTIAVVDRLHDGAEPLLGNAECLFHSNPLLFLPMNLREILSLDEHATDGAVASANRLIDEVHDEVLERRIRGALEPHRCAASDEWLPRRIDTIEQFIETLAGQLRQRFAHGLSDDFAATGDELIRHVFELEDMGRAADEREESRRLLEEAEQRATLLLDDITALLEVLADRDHLARREPVRQDVQLLERRWALRRLHAVEHAVAEDRELFDHLIEVEPISKSLLAVRLRALAVRMEGFFGRDAGLEQGSKAVELLR